MTSCCACVTYCSSKHDEYDDIDHNKCTAFDKFNKSSKEMYTQGWIRTKGSDGAILTS